MVTEKPSVVWILGSGFSKSLGGPLLVDLLSHRGKAIVQTRFKQISCENVYRVYWQHLKDSHETRSGAAIYWDPEASPHMTPRISREIS